MNCKFCGDVVDTNDTVCQSCGRTIDAPELHYRNDKLEKNDDLKGYYKDRKAKQKTRIPKLVTLLLIIFAYPLGLIAIIFTDFKHVTKLIMLGFGVGLPLLFLFSATSFEETTSYTFDEAIEVEVVEINDEKVQVTFVTDEDEVLDKSLALLMDNTDVLDGKKTLTLLEAVGVGEIEGIIYTGYDVYIVMCDGYDLEMLLFENELYSLIYDNNELYSKPDGFIAHLREFR